MLVRAEQMQLPLGYRQPLWQASAFGPEYCLKITSHDMAMQCLYGMVTGSKASWHHQSTLSVLQFAMQNAAAVTADA